MRDNLRHASVSTTSIYYTATPSSARGRLRRPSPRQNERDVDRSYAPDHECNARRCRPPHVRRLFSGYTPGLLSCGSTMKRISVRRSPVHGRGVFALRPLSRGERVFEYRGLVTTWREASRHYAQRDAATTPAAAGQSVAAEPCLVLPGGIGHARPTARLHSG